MRKRRMKVTGTVTRAGQNVGSTTPETASTPAATTKTALTFPVKIDQAPPNIKFCGRREFDRSKRKVIRANEPIESFNDGPARVELPSADFQKRHRLFYHKSAALIAATFPQLYKLIRRGQ